jgi:hypothetical protein
MGPPDVDATGAGVVGKERLGCHDRGEVGVLGEVAAALGGRVSQESVRRQLARMAEKEIAEIGSWVDV